MRCSVLQCAVVCCDVLYCVAISAHNNESACFFLKSYMISEIIYESMCWSVLGVCWSVMQFSAMCYSVLQYVVVRCYFATHYGSTYF